MKDDEDTERLAIRDTSFGSFTRTYLFSRLSTDSLQPSLTHERSWKMTGHRETSRSHHHNKDILVSQLMYIYIYIYVHTRKSRTHESLDNGNY
jgi:hypothetical protein